MNSKIISDSLGKLNDSIVKIKGGYKMNKKTVLLTDAKQSKGGNKMLKEILLSTAVEVNKGGKKMRKKVLREINKVKELELYIKNYRAAKQNSEEYLEEYDFSKYPFNEEFDFFSREDVAMAALAIIGAASYKDDDGNYYFLYNNQFMELSEAAKEFAYFHELGHVVLGHNTELEDRKVKKEYLKCIKKGEVHRFEYEADFFAAKRVGKWQALSALEEVRPLLGPASVEVINKRMKAIFLSDFD